MPARKTADILRIRILANAALTSGMSEQGKEGVATFLEAILHDTGNYRGFRYLDGWQGTETFRRFYF